jgi:hypothetical protein
MKSWIDRLPWVKKKLAIDELVNRVASRSEHAVWQVVSARCMNMCPAEAYGYIRARALPVVQRELEIVRAHALLQSSRIQAQILESVLDRVVRTAHNHLRSVRIQTSRRIAA